MLSSFHLESREQLSHCPPAAAAAKSLQSCPTVRPRRQQPTRLLRPWDSPGKNAGVGCHFLLQCMKVKSESEVAQSCLTLCDPMDCSLPGSSSHGSFQARVLEWVAIAFSNCPPEQRLNLTPVLFLYNHKSFIHHFSKFFICHPPTPQTYSSGPSLEKASHMSFLDFIYVFRSDQSLSRVPLFATP